MINDHISDLFTRIRNAQRAGHKTADVNASKLTRSVLTVLKAEGLIDSFEEQANDGTAGKLFRISLKYYSSGKPVITTAKRVSKPGCRVYSAVEDIPRVACGLGIALVSTSKGVLSDREARRQKVGGEILALVG